MEVRIALAAVWAAVAQIEKAFSLYLSSLCSNFSDLLVEFSARVVGRRIECSWGLSLR